MCVARFVCVAMVYLFVVGVHAGVSVSVKTLEWWATDAGIKSPPLT